MLGQVAYFGIQHHQATNGLNDTTTNAVAVTLSVF